MIPPQKAAEQYQLQPGVVALPNGLLWLQASRALIAADAHLAYEELIGGALPLWSTAESLATLLAAIRRMHANELILLGDIIHGSRMSEGAATVVRAALGTLRERCKITLVAGNHEGKSRGKTILGTTVESAERDGWHLVHGDDPLESNTNRIVGHLHPTIALGGDRSVPAFLACAQLIVVPALTPYSRGLDVLSKNCSEALKALVRKTTAIEVVASSEHHVLPFGSLTELKTMLRGAPTRSRYSRPVLEASDS